VLFRAVATLASNHECRSKRYVSSKGSKIKASGSLLSQPARVYIVLTSRFRNETLFLRAHSQKMSPKKLNKQPVVNVPIFKISKMRA